MIDDLYKQPRKLEDWEHPNETFRIDLRYTTTFEELYQQPRKLEDCEHPTGLREIIF